jgi:uncharacterized membrane protein
MKERNESGFVTLTAVLLFSVSIFMLALVVDGGRIMAERRYLNDVADKAARAATQELSDAILVTGDEAFVETSAARARARSFVNGATGGTTTTRDVRVTGGSTITVVVSKTIDLPMLGLLGVGTRDVVGSGSARATPALEESP